LSLFKHLRNTGIMGFIGGWLVILVSISRNNWFVFTENAFSDLGNPGANDPWIFNYGMMVTGLLIALYGGYLIKVSFNKKGTVGGASTIITGVFLTLIGIFPEGSKHHSFVSICFFTQGVLTVLIWGLALYRDEHLKREGVIFLVLSIFGTFAAFLVPWPSPAVAEAYMILILNIWVILMRRVGST